MKRLINIAGVSMTIEAMDEAAHGLITLALSSIPNQPIDVAQDVLLRLMCKQKSWQLEDHACDLRHSVDRSGDAIYCLTDRMAFHIADKAQHVHALHAAAVALGDNAVVIPAASGAGKSTFAAWLTAQGFDYITDELVLIDSLGLVDGLTRPIQMKPHGLSAIDHLLTNRGKIKHGNSAHAIPLDCLLNENNNSAMSTGRTLRAFIFPQYRNGADFLFNALSSAEAGLQLMACHVNARNLKGHGFSEMMRLVRETRSYSLDYGGFSSLPPDFSNQLKKLLQQG